MEKRTIVKEYEIVSIMSESYGNRYAKTLETVVSAINNKHYGMFNLESVKLRMDEVFEALVIKTRFDLLYNKSNGKLICNKAGFELEPHKFETLDEVEKALNNKAFL